MKKNQLLILTILVLISSSILATPNVPQIGDVYSPQDLLLVDAQNFSLQPSFTRIINMGEFWVFQYSTIAIVPIRNDANILDWNFSVNKTINSITQNKGGWRDCIGQNGRAYCQNQFNLNALNNFRSVRVLTRNRILIWQNEIINTLGQPPDAPDFN